MALKTTLGRSTMLPPNFSPFNDDHLHQIRLDAAIVLLPKMARDFLIMILKRRKGKFRNESDLWKEWAMENEEHLEAYPAIKSVPTEKVNGKQVPLISAADIKFIDHILKGVATDKEKLTFDELMKQENSLTSLRIEVSLSKFEDAFHSIQKVTDTLLAEDADLLKKWKNKFLMMKEEKIDIATLEKHFPFKFDEHLRKIRVQAALKITNIMAQDFMVMLLEQKFEKAWNDGDLWKKWAHENEIHLNHISKYLPKEEFNGKQVPIFSELDLTFINHVLALMDEKKFTTVIDDLQKNIKTVRELDCNSTLENLLHIANQLPATTVIDELQQSVKTEMNEPHFNFIFKNLSHTANQLLDSQVELTQYWNTIFRKIKLRPIYSNFDKQLIAQGLCAHEHCAGYSSGYSSGHSSGLIFTKNGKHHLEIDYSNPLARQSVNPNVFVGKICGIDEEYAVKQIILDSEKKKMEFETECNIMKTFDRTENFVSFIDSAIVNTGQRKGVLIMEKCDATFWDVIQNSFEIPLENGQNREELFLTMIKHVLTALSILASSNRPVAHKDLKPDNLFIKIRKEKREKDLVGKIGDFGISKEFLNYSHTTTQRIGHSNYLAPEILVCRDLKKIKNFTPNEWHAIDMFALGCCIAELFTGQHPFGSHLKYDIPMNVMEGNMVNEKSLLDSKYLNRVLLNNLVLALTQADPNERPTAKECLKHPLFEDAAQKILRQIEVNSILKKAQLIISESDVSSIPKRGHKVKPESDVSLITIENIQDSKKIIEDYDFTSALVIGCKGNWLSSIPKGIIDKCDNYNITKASELCRFLRNSIQHINDNINCQELKKKAFDDPNISPEDMFNHFKNNFPFLDSHDMVLMYKVNKQDEFRKFAQVQEFFEKKQLKEGLEDGSIKPPQTFNTIYLHHIPLKESLLVEIELSGSDVTPVIKMDKLRKSIKKLELTEGKFELIDAKENLLTNSKSILEGDHVYFRSRIVEVTKKPMAKVKLDSGDITDYMEGMSGLFLDDSEEEVILDSDDDTDYMEGKAGLSPDDSKENYEIVKAERLFFSTYTNMGIKYHFGDELPQSFFHGCFQSLLQLCKNIANLMGSPITYITDVAVSSYLIRFGPFEVLMTQSTMSNKSTIWFLLHNSNKHLKIEAMWFIMLNAISEFNFSFNTHSPICTLVCPKDVKSDVNGNGHIELYLDHLLTYEKVISNSNLQRSMLSCKCEDPRKLTEWFPTEFAVSIFEHEALKMLWSNPTADSIALFNLVFVLLTEEVQVSSSIISKRHPAMMKNLEKKELVNDVSQFLVNLEKQTQLECEHYGVVSKSSIEDCCCFLSNTKYVSIFEKLEENHLLITEKGNWKDKMDELYQELGIKESDGSPKKCEGCSFSVTSLLKELHNAIRHPDLHHPAPMKTIDKFFVWVIMRLFSFREIFILPENEQKMVQFAKAYFQQEKEEMSKAAISHPECLMIRIQSLVSNELPLETLMYVDLDLQIKELQQDIAQRFRFNLPVEEQLLIYQGPKDPAVPPKDETPLTDLNIKIKDLKLDTQFIQLFVVKEKPKEKVRARAEENK